MVLSTATMQAPHPPPTIDNNEQGLGNDKPALQTPTILPKQTVHKNKDKFLIHRARSAAMIKRAPSIAGLGLCRGWNKDATSAFIKAVEKLVELNPILSGHVYESNRSGRSELRIQSGTFPVDSLVNVIEVPMSEKLKADFELEDDNSDDESPNRLLEKVVEHCFPLLQESELTSDQMKKRLPLFSATVLLLPNNHAVYAMKLSHAIGDGVTFMMLLKQLSLVMSGKDVPPIDWDHPQKETHELFPNYFSNHDISCMYGAPFLFGAAKNILQQTFNLVPPRSTNVLLFDKQKVNQMKRRLREDLDCPDLSANDIITAALCQSNQSSDMFVFTENVRNGQIIGHNVGGNFLVEIPVNRETASHPDQLRHAVTSSKQQQSDTTKNEKQSRRTQHKNSPTHQRLPVEPFLHGKVARITSLATIPASLVYDGTEQLCTLPYLSFLSKIPLDTALIFRFNAQYWGVIHNFADLEPGELLKELLDE